MPKQARTQPIEQRRRSVMAAAKALFLKKGVAACSVAEIADRAGIGKGSFYLYFDGKEAVAAALRTEFSRSIFAAAEARGAACADGDWACRLEAWIAGALEACLKPASIALNEALFHGGGSMRDAVAGHAEPIAALGAFLEAGAAAGAWPAEDLPFKAVALYHAFHGVLDHAIAAGAPNAARLTVGLTRLFRQVLGGEFAAGTEPLS